MLLSLSNSASVFSCAFLLWLFEFIGVLLWVEQPSNTDNSIMFAINFMIFILMWVV